MTGGATGRLLWLLLLRALAATAAHENACDPQLMQPANNPYGYRLRDDRCEGVYVQQVGGTPLVIASWTQVFEAYDLSSATPLSLEWDTPGNSEVHLRGESLRRRLYYRMDAIRQGGKKSFLWPVSLLAALGLSSEELGVTATTRLRANDGEREVYLPLRAGQSLGRKPRTPVYQLVVIPSVELSEVFLAVLGPDGRDRPNGSEPLHYGYYPAGRAIRAPVAGLKRRGIYHLRVGGEIKSGGTATVDAWVYHPGE